MNLLTEVKEKYPKAYEKFREYVYSKPAKLSAAIENCELESLSGWLTAFFDGEELGISPGLNRTTLYDVVGGGHYSFVGDRSDTFPRAAMKAFEILEERL